MPLFSVCVCVFSPWFVFFVLLLVHFFGCFRYLFIYLFLFIFSCIDAEKTQQSCYLLNFLTRNPEVMEFKLDSSSGLCDIECFHVTSRRSYWCPKTMKRRPCWCLKTNPVGVELFSCANAFFCSNKFT